jgi:transcriptional regulator with XRE-family HTH domain
MCRLTLVGMCVRSYYSKYMEESKQHSPFQTLGNRLKSIRENRRESLAEVSGAVEIDTDVLERIELGQERPSEDILMLLISHFGVQEPEAVQLWESAGYGQPNNDERFPGMSDRHGRPTMVLLAIDARVMYTDGVAVVGTPQGITMHFTQQAGQPRPMPVSRVGMSYEQAEEVLRVLQQAVFHHRYAPPQQLLSPGDSTPK